MSSGGFTSKLKEEKRVEACGEGHGPGGNVIVQSDSAEDSIWYIFAALIYSFFFNLKSASSRVLRRLHLSEGLSEHHSNCFD